MPNYDKFYKSFEKMTPEKKLEFLHDEVRSLIDTVLTGQNSVLRRLENLESRKIDEDRGDI